MGTLTVQASTTAQGMVYNHAFNIPDADMTRIIAAYQSAANSDMNGTATSNQVFTYIVKQWIAEMNQAVVISGNTSQIAALPPTPPIVVS